MEEADLVEVELQLEMSGIITVQVPKAKAEKLAKEDGDISLEDAELNLDWEDVLNQVETRVTVLDYENAEKEGDA